MDDVVLISGGSRGLGRSIASDLLSAGYRVATFSRASTEFIERAQSDDKTGERFLWERIDATDFDGLRRFALRIARKFGRLDGLVNNAGMASVSVLPLARAEDIHSLLTVNLESAIMLSQACAKIMLAARRGTIVNISSLNAIRGNKGVSVYSAAKAGLDGFTRSLARELGPRGVRVNSIAPGYLETDMTHEMTEERRAQIVRRTPLGRLGGVDDVTGVVRFLLSPESRFITGQTLVVDGGLTC